MIVPVVFSFDSNLILSAKVCIYSLLKSAMASTFYDIYILYPSQADFDRNAAMALDAKLKGIELKDLKFKASNDLER